MENYTENTTQVPLVTVRAEKPVAYQSPDHIMPWGTRSNNSRNKRFNQKLYHLYSNPTTTLKILDIGCSGGGFVKDCIDDGCFAIGLEGSDYSQKFRRAEWATIPNFLFTCDVTGDFDIYLNNELIRFDVVTAWELIEHIAEADLSKVAENVRKHLAPGGLWIMSVSPNEEIIGGVQLHQTVRPREWWIKTFKQLGFEHLEIYVQYFATQFVRGNKYGAPGSFHLVLSADTTQLPRLPERTLSGRLYDYWLGSRPQRILNRMVTGA